MGNAELGAPAVVGLLVLFGLAVLIQRNASRVPQWLRQDGTALLHHQALHLTSAQSLWLAIRASVVLALLVALLLAGAWMRGRLRKWLHPTQLYDPQLVRTKTEHVAYHARLRILVIGPTGTLQKAPGSAAADVTPTSGSVTIQTLLSLPSLTSRCVRHVRRQVSGPRAQAGGRPPRIGHSQEGMPTAIYHRVRRTALARMLYGLHNASPSSRWRLLRRYVQAARRARRRAWAEGQRARADTQAQMQRRRDVLEGFIGTYRQFHLATGGYFRAQRLPPRVARSIAATPHWCPRGNACTGWALRLARSTHILSVADVAALWHLPQANDVADLPFVERSRARTLLAPAALAASESGAFRVGSSMHAGHILPVHLPSDATRRNTLAIAKTGKGKSTLLLSLARAALADRTSGLVLIDPHGDLAETALALIPDHRRDDVLLVDLGDRAYPIGLNPLDVTLNPDRDKAVSNMIAVFSQIWKDFWGPRMESALEAALKTLHEVNQAEVADDPQDGLDRQFTLLDATPLMTFAAFRHNLLGRVRDPALTEYWMRFEALQLRLQQDIITPGTTKLDKFAHSVVARRIVGQGRSTLNMAEAIQQGRVVLVETARGIVGHDTSALVGATLLGLLQVTVGEQAAIPIEQCRRVRVVVDEFQTLEGVDFGAMLSELRKYGASFALATQALTHLDALDRALRPTVMANLDQLFAFAMSADDARMVERELDGVVESTDLITLDDFSCYARLTVDGRRLPVFSLALDPPPALDAAARAQADVLRRRSQKRIGRFVDAADTIIAHAAVRRNVVAEQHQQHQYQQHQLRGQYVRDGQRGEGAQQVSSRPPAAPRQVATDEKMGAADMGKTSRTSGTAPAATAGSLLPEMTQGTGAPGNASARAGGGAMETPLANSTLSGKPAQPVKRGNNRWSKKGKKRRHTCSTRRSNVAAP